LDFVVPALGKQRTNWAINDSRSKNFLFGRAAFAFEVTAGEFARRGRFFAVIDSEREEILAFLGLGGGDSGDEDNRFALLDGHRAVGLLGEFPGFNGDLIMPNLGSNFF